MCKFNIIVNIEVCPKLVFTYEPYFVYDISQRFCAHMKHTIKKPSMCMFMRSQNLREMDLSLMLRLDMMRIVSTAHG